MTEPARTARILPVARDLSDEEAAKVAQFEAAEYPAEVLAAYREQDAAW